MQGNTAAAARQSESNVPETSRMVKILSRPKSVQRIALSQVIYWDPYRALINWLVAAQLALLGDVKNHAG